MKPLKPSETPESDDLYEAAREVCHHFGMDWTDPRTGEVFKAPPTLSEAGFAADPVGYSAALGITDLKMLATGEWAGVAKQMYTTGLMVGVDWCGYRTRFCYETAEAAREALATWDGNDWPPGYWIKQKPEDVHGPGSKVPEKYR